MLSGNFKGEATPCQSSGAVTLRSREHRRTDDRLARAQRWLCRGVARLAISRLIQEAGRPWKKVAGAPPRRPPLATSLETAGSSHGEILWPYINRDPCASAGRGLDFQLSSRVLLERLKHQRAKLALGWPADALRKA